MSMNRKNYVMLAKTINESLQGIERSYGSDSVEFNTAKTFLTNSILPRLCNALHADNYAFSADRFMEACLKDIE